MSISICGVDETYKDPAIVVVDIPESIAKISAAWRNGYIRRFLEDRLTSIVDYDFEVIEND